MKSRDGFIPVCNVQTDTDAMHKMIVPAGVTGEYNDLNALEENRRKLGEQPGIEPEIIEADRGYANIKQIRSIESKGKTRCAIPLPAKGNTLSDEKNNIEFQYRPKEDCFRCPEGNKLKPVRKKSRNRGVACRMYRANAKICTFCRLFGICTQSKSGRNVRVSGNREFIDIYKERLNTAEMKRLIEERKTVRSMFLGQ
jgi:hypothetical protein